MDVSIEILRRTIRHNHTGNIVTVTFLVKANRTYQSTVRYFVAVASAHGDDGSQLVEFSCVNRAYDDVNAVRLAKLRGTVVDEPLEEEELYLIKIREAATTFFYITDSFVPTTLDELVGERDLNLDDADTISSFNLSQCSGDTTSEFRSEFVRKAMKELGVHEPESDVDCDVFNEDMADIEEEVMNSETTVRMLIGKYPEQEVELRRRHHDFWHEKTATLRTRWKDPKQSS